MKQFDDISIVLNRLSKRTGVSLNSAATKTEIQRLKQSLKPSIPTIILDYLAVANGEVDGGSDRTLGMMAGGNLLSVDGIIQWYEFCQTDLPWDDFDSPFVCKSLNASTKRIPVTWGYDLQFLIIDQQPTEHGVPGQILLSDPIYGASRVVASSFTDLLERIENSLVVETSGDIQWRELPNLNPNTGCIEY